MLVLCVGSRSSQCLFNSLSTTLQTLSRYLTRSCARAGHARSRADRVRSCACAGRVKSCARAGRVRSDRVRSCESLPHSLLLLPPPASQISSLDMHKTPRLGLGAGSGLGARIPSVSLSPCAHVSRVNHICVRVTCTAALVLLKASS